MTTAMLGILLVVLSTLIEGVGEILLKLSQLDRARQVFWVAIGVAVFAVQMSVYTVALKYLQISEAFALSSLSFVVVALLSRLILGEAVTPIRWLGVALMVGGTILIGAYA